MVSDGVPLLVSQAWAGANGQGRACQSDHRNAQLQRMHASWLARDQSVVLNGHSVCRPMFHAEHASHWSDASNGTAAGPDGGRYAVVTAAR